MAYETVLPPKPHRGRLTDEEETSYVEGLDDSQRALYQEQKEQREQQRATVGQRPGRRRREASLEDDITITELEQTLHSVFEAASLVIRSDEKWTDEEFHNISKGLIVVINKVPPLKLVIRFLTPLASVAQIFQKVRKLLGGVRKQDSQDKAS